MHDEPTGKQSVQGWRRQLLIFALATLVTATAVAPRDAAAFFSLPTGPSEKDDEVPAAPAPAVSAVGERPAVIKVLADREFQTALEGEIAAARTEITISAYLFAAKDAPGNRPRAVVDRLAEAAARGVKVEVVLEIGRESGSVTQANRATARMLVRRGVKVLVDSAGTTAHSKLVVIDRRRVFVGSHDLTESSLGQYREVSLFVESPTLAAALLEQVALLKPVPYVEPPRRAAKRGNRPGTSRSR